MFLELKVIEDGHSRDSLYLHKSRLRRLTGLEPRILTIQAALGVDRRRVEQFIEAAYARAFGGCIASHYPALVSIRDGDGQIIAAAGFRLAADGPLFLEQYLDQPIETAISDAPRRGAVAEIGNLAADGRGASLFLIIGLMEHLQLLGCTHAALTLTTHLAGSFANLGFASETLAEADPARLPDGGASWGRYYEHRPKVLAGRLGQSSSLARHLVADRAMASTALPLTGCAA